MELKEIRDKIKSLFTKVEEMKKQNETNNTEPTPEERKLATDMLDEIDALEEMAANQEMEERMNATKKRLAESRREVLKPDFEKINREKGFRSLGDFLQAVVGYYAAGGQVDPRLTRAITGAGEAVPQDGGFLVQTDFAAELLQKTYTTGQVVSRARRIPISGNANGLKINAVSESSRASGSRWGGILAYWKGEGDTKTASQPKFRQMELSLKKLIGLCYATDELLQDASALESVIRQSFTDEFAFQLDDALINGSGAGMPLGILNSGCRVNVSRDTASSVLSEDIINMWARLYAPSRPNSAWFINQDVEPQLYQMSLAVGTAGGQLTYMPPGGLSNAPYATLMGRPVVPIEQCQTLGTAGDVILADFSEYLMIEKGGIQSASSIHVRFVNDETCFRFVLRIDGQPTWNTTLTPYKGSNTLSPFIVLN